MFWIRPWVYVCWCVWYKITDLERQNGDLRRQMDRQLQTMKPDVDHDSANKLSRDELARRYCKHNTHRRRDSTVQLIRVGGVYTAQFTTSWRLSRRSWTNLPIAKSSYVVSAAWTHPIGSRDPVPVYNFLCCWAIEAGDKWRHVIVAKVINIDQNLRSWTVAALRCGKAVQMHCQFVAMHCQLHCLCFRKRKQNLCQ